MKVLTAEQILSKGRFVMVYSDTGVGKTTSLLQSAPLPIDYIQAEKRSLQPQIEAAERDDLVVGKTLKVSQYDNFLDLLDYVTHPENFEPGTTIVVDSYTHLMNFDLMTEISTEAFEQRTEKEKKKVIKTLVESTKMSMEGYGGLSAQMTRLTSALQKLSVDGRIVVVTALLEENPRWNRGLSAAPALAGKDFPKKFPGFFDLIGLLEPRVVNNEVVYPPRVRFESDGTFTAKWTGKSKKRSGPFNLQKILENSG